jgi:hypothetical protein
MEESAMLVDRKNEKEKMKMESDPYLMQEEGKETRTELRKP